MRRSTYGGMITLFNSAEDIADYLSDDLLFDTDTFAAARAASDVTAEEASEVFRRQFDISNCSLSVVRRSKEA